MTPSRVFPHFGGCAQLLRRDALRIGGLGMLGLSMPRFSAAAAQASAPVARAKSVIFLYQFGGPSCPDTFDMKPEAPDGVRSWFGCIPTSAPGIEICELLPETAKVMDKVTLVRTVHHTMKNHNSAAYYSLTGHAPALDDIRLRDTPDLFPAYGSVVDRLAPSASGTPTFVAYPYVIRDGAISPGQHASFLGKAHDPLLITEDPNAEKFGLPELSLPANLSVDRINNRRELQRLINRQTSAHEQAASKGLDAFFEKALTMLHSPRLRQAFDLSSEPQAVRERYGRTTYGQSCLLARRLVEADVKFINVYFSSTIGGRSTTGGGWDTHGFDKTAPYPIMKDYHLPLTEHTLPVLLNDLEERGLLDTTLVVWMGEFGRTPHTLTPLGGRNHWPACYTALLAGGGVKRGYVHGRSDKLGAYPDRDGVPIEDLAATIYTLLGLDPQTEVHDNLNRPLPIAAGKAVTGIFA